MNTNLEESTAPGNNNWFDQAQILLREFVEKCSDPDSEEFVLADGQRLKLTEALNPAPDQERSAVSLIRSWYLHSRRWEVGD